jgi:hypothetical protein
MKDIFKNATLNTGNIKLLNAALASTGFRGGLSPKVGGGRITFMATGQSNISGLKLYTDKVVMNPRVKTWQAPIDDPTNYQLMVADPYRESNYSPTDWFVGTRGQGYANIAWLVADIIQRATNEDVVFLQVAKPSQSQVLWDAGAAGDLAIAAQVPAFLAAVGATKFDFALWLQGEADVVAGVTASNYLTTMEKSVLPAAEASGWYIPYETPLLMIDIPEYWSETWSGIVQCAQGLTGNVHFIPTAGLPSDGHFFADAAKEIARRCAFTYLLAAGAQDYGIGIKTPLTGRQYVTSTGADPAQLMAGQKGSVTLQIWCNNTAKTKFWTGLVHYWNLDDVTTGASIIYQSGEAGFTPVALVFAGFRMGMAGTVGETWHWCADSLHTKTLDL